MPCNGPENLEQATPALQVEQLGRMSYAAAFEMQRRVHAEVVAGQRPMTLLLVEHHPVITISRRRQAAGHLVADAQTLADMGIEVQSTDRGGDITYHGPGQVVAYPILSLARLRMNLGRYIRWLEQVVMDVLAHWGVAGLRDPAATGVWVDPSRPELDDGAQRPVAKIAAIGVRISRNVSLHGLALNVRTDLSHFNTIVPCGLAGRPVTSLEQVLGPRCPEVAQVADCLAATIRRQVMQHTSG